MSLYRVELDKPKDLQNSDDSDSELEKGFIQLSNTISSFYTIKRVIINENILLLSIIWIKNNLYRLGVPTNEIIVCVTAKCNEELVQILNENGFIVKRVVYKDFRKFILYLNSKLHYLCLFFIIKTISGTEVIKRFFNS